MGIGSSLFEVGYQAHGPSGLRLHGQATRGNDERRASRERNGGPSDWRGRKFVRYSSAAAEGNEEKDSCRGKWASAAAVRALLTVSLGTASTASRTGDASRGNAICELLSFDAEAEEMSGSVFALLCGK